MGGIDFAATQGGLMHMRTAILQHVSLNVMIDSSYGKVTQKKHLSIDDNF